MKARETVTRARVTLFARRICRETGGTWSIPESPLFHTHIIQACKADHSCFLVNWLLCLVHHIHQPRKYLAQLSILDTKLTSNYPDNTMRQPG